MEGERIKTFESTNLKRETKQSCENWSFCEFLICDSYAMKEEDHPVFFVCYN